MKIQIRLILLIVAITAGFDGYAKNEPAQTFYLNSTTGSDSNDGLSPETAWKTLEKASQVQWNAGEKLLLCEGEEFFGKLEIRGNGTRENPIIVSSYSTGNHQKEKPLINGAGFLAGIQIRNGGNIRISNIKITADGGSPREEEAKTVRYGVLVEADEPGIYPNIEIKNLEISNIFASENINKDGQNPTSNMGFGIFVAMQKSDAVLKNIRIEDCKIEMTGHTGIRIFGFKDSYLDSVTILNNVLKNIGGPGMVPGICENVLVRGNVTDHTGSSIDPRMHARGSGIWPWTCKNVLIEKNKFMHARGKADSCGAHIDFNCSNVVVQYNLSLDNEGGFVEILGNDRNCCYRYNISINDGFRVKGKNGAHQEGKILWTSAYTGRGNKKEGPYNSYIYNNTVFVKEDIRSCFSFTKTTDGILIANNIFYITGPTADVSDDQDTKVADGTVSLANVVFSNNLYENTTILPASLFLKDSSPLTGNPRFKNTGGLTAEDYIPVNANIVKDKGIKIEKIKGDEIGLFTGLQVDVDFFGNPVGTRPDLGAVEIQ